MNAFTKPVKLALTGSHGTGKTSQSEADSVSLSEATGTRIGLTQYVPDAEAAYRKVLADVLATDHEIVGGETKSVGSKKRSKEILHYGLVIGNPRERLIWNAKRKLNVPAAVGRFVWMMAGNDRFSYSPGSCRIRCKPRRRPPGSLCRCRILSR